MKIRKIEKRDLDCISNLHLKTFSKDHFTSKFPKDLLKEYFYNLISANEYTILAENDEQTKLLGYIIAGTKSERVLNEFVKKNKIKLVFILLKSPKFILEKINDYIKSKFKIGRKTECKLRLFLIAVNIDESKKGIGKNLIDYLEDNLRKEGKNEYGLSVRKNNKNAINFYLNTGFKKEFESGKSIYFIKKI